MDAMPRIAGAARSSTTASTAASACRPARPGASWAEEMDSPRGRIDLMRGLSRRDDRVRTTRSRPHFDRCLGCMACVTACPSGVRYDVLIEATARRLRGARASRRPPTGSSAGWSSRLFPYPRACGSRRASSGSTARYGLARGCCERRGLLAARSPRLAQLDALAPPVRSLERSGPGCRAVTRPHGERRGAGRRSSPAACSGSSFPG